MTTATLRPVTKETVSETPEKLYPCRGKLTQLLAEHAAIISGLEEFESRLQRSQLDLNEAISRDDDVEISRFQGMESVFHLKLSAKRANLKQLVDTIPQAVYAASNEFSTLLLDERNRRTTALSERIAKVLGADPDRLIQGRYLDDLLDEAEPVKEIDRLRFSTNLVGASEAVTLCEANRLLDYFGEIVKASREDV